MTYSFTRQDLTNHATFTAFITYLLGKDTQSHIDNTATGRTLRHRFSWCWTVPTPPLTSTGEIYDQLFIDGIHLAYNWVLLTAVTEHGHVVARQWATSENTPAYEALLSGLPAPQLIICDGATGALKAIHHVWGTQAPPIQRCLVHIHRNNIRDLTQRPHTAAGQALKRLSQQLLTIRSTQQATTWMVLLDHFHTRYNTWLNQRTYARDNPDEARRRRKYKPTQWWYTHDRDRRVYTRLERLTQQGVLFNFLTINPARTMHCTTNIVESLNARIKAVTYHHRGLSEPHLLSAIDWMLYYKWVAPQHPKELYTQWDQEGRPTREIVPRTRPVLPLRIGPALYDTHTTAEEGLWARKGWAGRHS